MTRASGTGLVLPAIRQPSGTRRREARRLPIQCPRQNSPAGARPRCPTWQRTPANSTSRLCAMTEATERDHLFISYATEDAALAEWLTLKLTAGGYRVWCDRVKLLGGESYPRNIDAAIEKRTFRM